MRLPTLSQFRVQAQMLSSQYERLGYLQTQAISEKKILRSSENPSLADNIKSVQDHIGRLKSFDNNLSLAESRQSQKEALAVQSINMTNRIQELLMRAQNDTNNEDDRRAISKELEGLASQFFDAANTSDANGEYIFSGFNIHSPAFRNEGGKYIYQGSDRTSKIAIGLDIKVEYSDSGYDVFGAIPTGNGSFTVASDAINNTGSGVFAGGKLIDHASYVEDDYTLSIVTNSSGNLAYQVTGANGGQIIPTPPASAPADAPDYISGEDIIFNGMSFQMTGSPDEGDTFFVNPSKDESVFSSLNALIQTLNAPADSDKSKADLKQKLGELQQNFEQVATQFRTYQQKTGNQGTVIDNQKRLSEDLQLNEEIFLRNLSNVNIEQVLTEISQQNIALQLTQKIYLQIQETMYPMLMGG